MGEIAVTLASDQEARACLALLPEARDAPAELLIARRGRAFAGAAALLWQSGATPAGFPTAIHVVPEQRRQGVGRELLGAAADLAAEETIGLWSMTPVAEQSDAARFMYACGCVPKRRERHFEAAVDALLDVVAPKADRMRARGHVPNDLRIQGLADAPLEEVGWVVSSGLGGDQGATLSALRRRAPGGSEHAGDRSSLVIREGRVWGVILWRVVDGVGVVDARVVHATCRGAWPNVVLLEAGLRRARDEGVSRFRFHCDDTVRDTLSLARRCAAVETETKATWYYAIAAD